MTTNSGDEASQGRRRAQLVMLALLFMAPVMAAWVAWQYVGEHGVGETTNAGQLVVPAQRLPELPLAGLDGGPLDERALRSRWTYVMLAPAGGCDAGCEQWLYETRQLRISINKDFPRVHRLLILDARPDAETLAALEEEHPDLTLAFATGEEMAEVRRTFAAAAPAEGSHVFLVDPLGNLMMTYDARVDFKGMFKDLRKLLKVSQIG